MKAPCFARYNYVYKRVVEFFYDFDVTDFPINPINIIDSIEDCHLLTYRQFGSVLKTTAKGVQDKFENKDGFTLLRKGQYFIVYNENQSIGRRNFTLMHEIGHLYLGHLVDFDCVRRDKRSNLTDTEYRALENEANVFARNTLAPIVAIDASRISPDRVQDVFCLTYGASNVRNAPYIVQRDRYGIGTKNAERLRKQFRPFLHKKICFHCGHKLVTSGRFCPICRSPLSWDCEDGYPLNQRECWELYNIEWREPMKYANYELTLCPTCFNEDIQKANFCKICGSDLRNRCTNEECGELVDANARYCPKCGSETSWLKNDVFNYYREEYEAQQNQLAPPPGIDFDEEVPF